MSSSKKGDGVSVLAPVAVYTYTRIDHFVKTIEALKANNLASLTTLYVVSDGAKCDAHKPIIQDIRNYTEDLTGFREVVKLFRPTNLGVRESLPQADRQIVHDHGRMICLEDDNIVSSNFLDFMNAALQKFEDDEKTYSVCGYCPPISDLALNDAFDYWRYPWNISWGYGIWKEKYQRFHPVINHYQDLKRRGLLKKQNAAGGLYVSDSLRRDYLGQCYFPDAALCSNLFESGMSSIMPTRSKVLNVGQDGSGQSSSLITHKYAVPLDTSNKTLFNFDAESPLADRYRNDAQRFYNGGVLTRIARHLGVYHDLLHVKDHLKQKLFS